MHKTKRTFVLILIAMLIISLGCATMHVNVATVTVGELINESRTIALENAQQVRATVKMGAGDLKIDGGANELLEADFTYNVVDWKPEINYTVADETGRLVVRQPNSEQIAAYSAARYKWKLLFNEDVPLDMRIEYAGGSGELDLGNLNITRLDIQLGAGDLMLDLSGNQSLRNLEFDMVTGKTTLDLNGDWAENVYVNFQGGVGQTTMRLPQAIGVRVITNQALGRINARGLSKQGNAYVNDAYGVSAVTLEINIQAGVGEINLEIVE